MTAWEKDRIARQTADLRVTFDMALSNKRKYPVAEFKAFVQSARRYIEITSGDPMIHKSIMRAVNGLREFLEVNESEFLEISCLSVRGGEKRRHFRRNRAEPMEPVWRAHWRGSVRTLHQLLNLV
ncbi:MAG TPA: hypothetical protein VHZ07_03510 [Bryobacteraceae bacterium]|jgi:hypothetical protein|nr:hypothetical protein [Bryobacteraceae bacterium]